MAAVAAAARDAGSAAAAPAAAVPAGGHAAGCACGDTAAAHARPGTGVRVDGGRTAGEDALKDPDQEPRATPRRDEVKVLFGASLPEHGVPLEIQIASTYQASCSHHRIPFKAKSRTVVALVPRPVTGVAAGLGVLHVGACKSRKRRSSFAAGLFLLVEFPAMRHPPPLLSCAEPGAALVPAAAMASTALLELPPAFALPPVPVFALPPPASLAFMVPAPPSAPPVPTLPPGTILPHAPAPETR